ncbi:hypothetical protein D1872_200280 [compost metagenome]
MDQVERSLFLRFLLDHAELQRIGIALNRRNRRLQVVRNVHEHPLLAFFKLPLLRFRLFQFFRHHVKALLNLRQLVMRFETKPFVVTSACNTTDARGNFSEWVRQSGRGQPAVYINVDPEQHKEQQSRLRQGAPEDRLIFGRSLVERETRLYIFFRQPDHAVSNLSVIGAKRGNGGVKRIFLHIVK